MVKINTDGSSNITKRTAGIGGVVRNRNGDLIMAFAKAFHFCTNNQTEVQAALYALNWCRQNNMTNCILEMDSLMTINMMKGVYKPFWIHDSNSTRFEHKSPALL